MTEFVHLHTHSHFSMLDGLNSPEELVKCAKNSGFKALALTDHGNCAGLYHFQKACVKEEIKPILGMEAYTCADHTVKEKDDIRYHLVIIAKNRIGYKNLIALNSSAYIDGFYYKPRIDFKMLEERKEGLIVSSACCAGEIPSYLWSNQDQMAIDTASKFKDVFGDDFYLEIMTHKYENSNKDQEKREVEIAKKLFRLSKKLDIKPICTQDIHYAHRGDWEEHDILLSISTLDNIKNPNRLTFGSKDFYMKPIEEMADLYKNAPQLLSNTLEIAEKVETDLIIPSEDLVPSFDLPEGFKKEEDYLKQLVTDGMKEKGFINKPEYRERIKYEMSIIIGCNYTKYFLVLWDIINFARNEKIRVGIGRGSAVSSLCLYVLGIVKLDPIKHNLIFERFLNPDRISPPDVDIDFDYYRRSEVYDYVIRKYGSEYCCQIGTYNTYKARGVIRSASKALDLGGDWDQYLKDKKVNPSLRKPQTKRSLDVADSIAKTIPKKAESIEEALKMSNNFRSYMHKYPRLMKAVRVIEGGISSAGIHPAALVVCKDPVINHIPLRMSKGAICTQYDMKEVEKLGLLKFDFLALKTLSTIDKTIDMIKNKYPKMVDFEIDDLEPNDPKIFAMLSGRVRNLDTNGIFQFEADGISKLLSDIRVDTFEDMVVANALYRPGPLGAGVHTMYCNYKHGREEIQYLHPKMGEALESTYGMMVFQENIMQVAVKLAGFTNAQSDTLRYAVGKKIPELLAEQKELFINGCVDNGISKDIAMKIFEQIDYFSGYGFNKSHSAAYAFLAYQTAYLKYYFPTEYMCNLLSSEIGDDDKLRVYLSCCARMGISIHPPNINKSGTEFKVEGIGVHQVTKNKFPMLRQPLTMLKGIGTKAVQNIVENQPFANLREFIEKTKGHAVNKNVFKTLVEADCMSDWNVSNDILLKQYEDTKKKIDKEKKAKNKQDEKMNKLGAGSLFGDEFDYSGKNLDL